MLTIVRVFKIIVFETSDYIYEFQMKEYKKNSSFLNRAMGAFASAKNNCTKSLTLAIFAKCEN